MKGETRTPVALLTNIVRDCEVYMDESNSYELWKELVYQSESYPKFEVSNTGQLRNTKTKHIYKQHLNHQGYYQVCVSLGSRSSKKVFKIHRAVAETFVENPYNKQIINHIDGIKTNNNAANLEFVTHQENTIHAVKNGLTHYNYGEDVHNAKFTNDEVRHIREIYIENDKEFGCCALAKKYNVNHSVISRIIHNKHYAYV